MENECRLFQGLWAILAQGILGALAFSSLVLKRFRENPKRPWTRWSLDVSKQVIALGSAHIFAMLVAIFTSRHRPEASECAWYLSMFILDTMIGTGITYLLHLLTLSLLNTSMSNGWCFNHQDLHSIAESIVTCGEYGDPPSLRRWIWQVLEWTLCVLVARLFCGILLLSFSPILSGFSLFIDSIFGQHTTLELYVVMILCPLCLNAIQALVQDTILKSRLEGTVEPKLIRMESL